MRTINALLSASVLLIFLFPQSLAAPPGGHLNIEEVIVTIGDTDTTIEINGWDFDFGSPLEVTLAGVPATITSATGVNITATVPTVQFPAGDYLLTVSTGNGQSQNDEYDLTIGAVGAAGPEGAAGVDGDDGAPGADGADGQDGTSCAVDQGAGSATVNCTDGSSATVFDGASGAPGQDGADGAEGPEGPEGPQGEPGPPGTAGDVCDLETRIKIANPAFELDEACIVPTEGVIFVANTGNDSNPGTQALPMATIGAASALAAMSNSVVHVQTGSYSGFSVIDGVSVIGGFDAIWQQLQLQTTVASNDIAVRATNVQLPTILQYLTLNSGRSADGSSYGLFAVDSDGLSILDSFISAVDGATGGNGGNGNSGSSGSSGGRGGNGVEDSGFLCNSNPRPLPGSAGSPGGGVGGLSGHGTGGGFSGGFGNFGATGGSGGSRENNGGIGSDGVSGSAVMDGVRGQPNYAAPGYSATDGTDGQDGRDGGGAGGGGGGGGGDDFCDSWGGAGGGGGGGGEGGTKGTGGDSAGGSFAVYLWNSDVTIEGTALTTGNGGQGGNGGAGGSDGNGAAGGLGGNREDDSGAGGRGGQGGDGSRGGHGGRGRGGPSIGVLLGGNSNPTLTSVTYTLGVPGANGSGPGPAPSAPVGAETHSPP